MTLEPLKSALSIGNMDDTSLALPSVNRYRSGQERVLDQVQTIRRTKTKQSTRGGSTPLTPTSPLSDNVFTDFYTPLPATANGNGTLRNGLSATLSKEGTFKRQTFVNNNSNTTRGSVFQRRMFLSNQHEKGFVHLGSAAGGKTNTSRSEPDMGVGFCKPKPAFPSRHLRANRASTHLTEKAASQFVLSERPPLNSKSPSATAKKSQLFTSQSEMDKAASKHSIADSARMSKGDLSNGGVADLTMKDAVRYLSSEDKMYQHCGASFIQHHTFAEDRAKHQVLELNGVPPLVGLLRSANLQIQQTASAALRNLTFKNNDAKQEVAQCGGVREAVALLRDTDCSFTQKQLTGLLWNLSSTDSLKPDLLQSALPVLMERVILPYTTGPDRTNNNSLDPEVFFNATGCLRNLSSAKQNNRQAMRKCRGLVDSLVSYVHDSVEAGTPDDKSVENCVCILHNLTFQLETEAQSLFNKITALARTANMSQSQGEIGPIGCFSPQSNKELEQERHFDYPVSEDLNPKGAGWLIHSKTMQSYLSLLGSSQRDNTLEACCGALQNLTTQPGIVSSVMSQTIVQKLNGLEVIAPLLNSTNINLQKSTVALVGNLTKNWNLQPAIARKTLPNLVSIVNSGTKGANDSDDTLAIACQTAHCLVLREPELCKCHLNTTFINSLRDLSQNRYFPKSSKAASVFLYNLWLKKGLQSLMKKVCTRLPL
ncbi:plakophilin-1 isoform X2 [Lampris incognitus]|uniref:plakophilin-1 isoform X2 n=1 Tax=Lampris incognitus TaxID=2546036 RepID=UPI0024B60BCC|nr:plakophilin-1 isoform X2 [Lampris incognitus]